MEKVYIVRYCLDWKGNKEDSGVRVFSNKDNAVVLFFEKCYKYKKLPHRKDSENEKYLDESKKRIFVIDKDIDHLAAVSLAEYNVE